MADDEFSIQSIAWAVALASPADQEEILSHLTPEEIEQLPEAIDGLLPSLDEHLFGSPRARTVKE